jgi:CBS domain-containing protein
MTVRAGAMHIGHILNVKGHDVITLSRDANVADAAALLTRENIGIGVIARDDGTIDGLISERDIVHGIVRFGAALLDMPARDLMTREVLTCSPDTRVGDVLLMMSSNEIRHIPIVEDGRPVGMISMRDVVDTRLGELEAENESLRMLLSDAA